MEVNQCGRLVSSKIGYVCIYLIIVIDLRPNPCSFVSRMQHREWYGLPLLYGMMACSNGMCSGR